MKTILFIGVITACFYSCSVKPEPLNFGKDGCYTCKMTLMDQKFGSEIVTKKGKIYKFDDVNCLISFYKSGYEPVDNIEHTLIVDFLKPGELLEAKTAKFIQSDAIRSPMASQVAAFSGDQNLDSLLKEWNGKVTTWNELLKQFE
jgi:copper chaperone NosL